MAQPAVRRTLVSAKSRTASLYRRVFTEAPEALADVKSATSPRAFAELPGPPGLPVVGNLLEYFRKPNRGQMHEVQRRLHKCYGKIFKEPFGPVTNVSVADPSLVEEILRSEGKYPIRPPYQSWVLYNQLRHRKGGLMTASDQMWKKCRSALSPRLMRPKHVGDYVGGMNAVVDSLIARLEDLLQQSGDSTVAQLPNELSKFTMETLTWVLLDRRLGCLESDMPQEIQNFINAIAKMFLTGHQLMAFAGVHKLLRTSVWRQHVDAWDVIYETAQSLIDQEMLEIEERLGQEPKDGELRANFLFHLLSSDKISRDEVYDNITEVLLGGVDTAANSLSFLVYSVAKYEEVQHKLRQEVDTVLEGRKCSYEDLQRMPYLKAVVKETLRLFPPIPINARIAHEDLVVDNYVIPKGTCILLNNYTMSRDSQIFSDPEKFIPERWLREEAKEWHPFSATPFGYGARSCVGRRIAETELYLATVRILQTFDMKLSGKFDIVPTVRTQLTPGPELPIVFEQR